MKIRQEYVCNIKKENHEQYERKNAYRRTLPNVVAVGNPCRVLRGIGDYDREYYYKDRKIDYDSVE